MMPLLSSKNLIPFLLSLLLTTTFHSCAFAAEDMYSSPLVNDSKRFILVLDRETFPDCVIDSGKKTVKPGETTLLKVKSGPSCRETGVIYGIYHLSDKNLVNRLGNLSHQHHRDSSKFTMQIGEFCGTKCAFIGLKQKVLIKALPNKVVLGEKTDNIELINQSQKDGSKGYKIIKTAVWPAECVIDSGKKRLYPGESTHFVYKKDPQCTDVGIGFEIYKVEDTKNKNLLGYISSHRYDNNGKLLLQIARFCINDKCVFRDFNPEQNR